MDRYLRDRIENITEQDFWSSLRKTKELAPAIEAGLAGKRARAYKLLGEYHANSLAIERDQHIVQVRSAHGDAPSDDIKRRADMAVRHEINGWHTQVIKFGKRIDFNADFGRSGQYGFHYLGWLTPALTMYAATGDTTYRDCLIDILKQYYEQRGSLQWRIKQHHPVYYELGARAKISLLMPTYAILCSDPALDTDAREGMLKLLMGCARSLYRLQKGGFRHGNWQIVGAQSCYLVGAAMPEFKEAGKWRNRCQGIIEEHRKQDFFSDGGHSERCWGYGHMSLHGMQLFYDAAVRYDYLTGAKRAAWTRFLKNAYQWFARSSGPNLSMLDFGDGGLGSAKGILDNAKRDMPELAELPGVIGVDRSASEYLKPSGYVISRTGDENGLFMINNVGKYGGGHTHNDLLDFDLWCYGKPLIHEVGRFGSYDNPLDTMFRNEHSHNQVTIAYQAFTRGGQKGRDIQWHSDERVDLLSAWHGCYEPMPTPIYRQVAFVKRGYVVVYDVVTAVEYNFQAQHWLHAPTPFERITRGQHKGGYRTKGTPSCLVVFADGGDIRRQITGVDYDKADRGALVGKSPKYMDERHHLQTMKWRDIGDPRPITFATLFVPFQGKQLPGASIKPVNVTGSDKEMAGAFEVTFDGQTDTFAFNPGGESIRAGRQNVDVAVAARVDGKWSRTDG